MARALTLSEAAEAAGLPEQLLAERHRLRTGSRNGPRVLISCGGELLSFREASERSGLTHQALRYRLKHDPPGADLLRPRCTRGPQGRRGRASDLPAQ